MKTYYVPSVENVLGTLYLVNYRWKMKYEDFKKEVSERNYKKIINDTFIRFIKLNNSIEMR